MTANDVYRIFFVLIRFDLAGVKYLTENSNRKKINWTEVYSPLASIESIRKRILKFLFSWKLKTLTDYAKNLEDVRCFSGRVCHV